MVTHSWEQTQEWKKLLNGREYLSSNLGPLGKSTTHGLNKLWVSNDLSSSLAYFLSSLANSTWDYFFNCGAYLFACVDCLTYFLANLTNNLTWSLRFLLLLLLLSLRSLLL